MCPGARASQRGQRKEWRTAGRLIGLGIPRALEKVAEGVGCTHTK